MVRTKRKHKIRAIVVTVNRLYVPAKTVLKLHQKIPTGAL